MKLVATLVNSVHKAHKILNEIPDNSVILFPELPELEDSYVRKISKEKQLFVIYNHDIRKNGKTYITMKGVDNGKQVWRVRKYHLWKTDYEDYAQPPAPEPIVNIRGITAAVEICYGMSKIGGHGRLFHYGYQIAKHNPEILLFPANWEFNWHIPEDVIASAIKCIPSVKVALFSCTRCYAIASTRAKAKKIISRGWVEIDALQNLWCKQNR